MAILLIQLGQDIVDVKFDGADLDRGAARDQLVALAGRQVGQDFHLALGQAGGALAFGQLARHLRRQEFMAARDRADTGGQLFELTVLQ